MRASSLLCLAAALASVLFAACGGGREPAANQLAYIDADGNIMLVNSDGSDAHKIADTRNCGRFPYLIWSPTGDRLTCIGSGANGEGLVVLMDAQGQEVTELKLPGAVWPFYWSPSGQAFLYGADGQLLLANDSGETLAEPGPLELSVTYNAELYRGLKFWSPDGRQFAYRPADATEMRIYSLDSAGERSLAGDYRPLAWVLGGKALLVATKYQPPVPGGYPTYEVSLLDLASGELTRVPELDNGRQFWVSRDGTRAAVLTQGTGGTDGYPGLAMLAFPSREFKPIRNSVITYGSDHIPEEWVTFTANGSQIYWITQWESGAAVFRANSDGTGLSKMAQFESPGAEFSPDLTMVAYGVFDEKTHTVTLYTANIDGTGVHEIDRADTGGGGFGFAPAWRPTS
jgi:WD40 repeat protein